MAKDTFDINNRRYIGSKANLIDFIQKTIKESGIEYNSLADLFSGTGIVAHRLAGTGTTYVNDLLTSNYISYKCFFGKAKINVKKIEKYIDFFNSEEFTVESNYMDQNFGDKYFSTKNAMRIGAIRQYIETIPRINSREKAILITSLLYAMDKVANTVGHYEAFLRKEKTVKPLLLKMPNIEKKFNSKIFNIDTNKLVKKHKFDLAYIDPPYNSRQYVNFYHMWENVAEWRMPNLKGVTLKHERSAKMSKYSQASATETFEEMIKNLKANNIIVSYSNTYSARSSASNNRILIEDMIRILKKKGDLKMHEINYKFFNTGKTNLANHKELLFVVKCK